VLKEGAGSGPIAEADAQCLKNRQVQQAECRNSRTGSPSLHCLETAFRRGPCFAMSLPLPQAIDGLKPASDLGACDVSGPGSSPPESMENRGIVKPSSCSHYVLSISHISPRSLSAYLADLPVNLELATNNRAPHTSHPTNPNLSLTS
jgi:hypothetical protein